MFRAWTSAPGGSRLQMLAPDLVALGLLSHDAARRHVVGQPDVAADRRSPSDCDATEDRRAGIDDDVIFDDRMAGIALDQRAVLIGREVAGAKRDGLVAPDLVADHGGLADHDPSAVIDEEAGPDSRARMNVDTGAVMGYLGDQPRHEARAKAIQKMCEPVMDDRRHPGIADQDLRETLGGWIADEGGAQVADQDTTQGRKPGTEAAGQRHSVRLTEAGDQLVADEQGGAVDLIRQQVEPDAEAMTNEIVDVLAVEIKLTKEAQKQGFGESRDDLRQLLARRRPVGDAVLADAVRVLPRHAQLRNEPVETPALARWHGVVQTGSSRRPRAHTVFSVIMSVVTGHGLGARRPRRAGRDPHCRRPRHTARSNTAGSTVSARARSHRGGRRRSRAHSAR